MRIAIAGFQHETNSFGVGKAGLAEFEMADSWPGLLTGQDAVESTRGINLPIAGFAEAAEKAGADLVPILWCAAEPSGPVTDAAFETITTRILDGVAQAGAIDGVYLDLHGAMITDSFDDGEGEVLRRLRRLVGPDLPVVISLDMHANLSAEMVRHADALTIFRTYPHLDMADTGARAFATLQAILTAHQPARAARQAPFLIPLQAQWTDGDPARALYQALASLDRGPLHFAEIALGFTGGDCADTGPAIVAHAMDAGDAERLADTVFGHLLDAETHFDCTLLTPHEAVARAMDAPPGRPAIIADVQDNPGAGASSDTTGLLSALVDRGATGAMLGLLHDPAAAAEAHRRGIGATFHAALGGHADTADPGPVEGPVRVDALGDGQCPYSGEMYGGGISTLGPTAVLSLLAPGRQIQVVVTSLRNQCLDLAHFTHIGLDPAAARIVVVKSTAHFRAAFQPIAGEVLLAAAPGAFSCQLDTLPYRRLRPGVRRMPNGSAPKIETVAASGAQTLP